jgi:hypothetical protein
MEAADVAALARLVSPRLRHMELLCPNADTGYRRFVSILNGSSTVAVTALAMGLPRPVDAEGRPASLDIFLGVEPVGGGARAAGGLERALVGAGRGWVRVVWHPGESFYND